MAANYTTNYQLPIWAAGDAFLRTEFNDAHEKIEDALTELDGKIAGNTADVAELTQYAGNCRIAAGSYTGTGKTGASYPNTLTFSFQPKLVIIGEDTNHSVFVYPCTKAAGQVLAHGKYGVLHLTWGDNSVSWYVDGYYNTQMNEGGLPSHQLNEPGTTYHYIALG